MTPANDVRRTASLRPTAAPLVLLILLVLLVAWRPGVPAAHAADAATTARIGPARLAPVPATGLTSLSASPTPLNLPFAPERHDYVLRCVAGQTVTFSGSVGADTQVRAVALGPAAPAPTLLRGNFTYTMTSPATTAVRLEVAAVAAPAATLATYHLRCLPASFPAFTATVAGTPQAAHYLVTWTTFIVVFNAEGTPVWWLDRAPRRPTDAKVIDGQLVSSEAGGDYYTFWNWDGTVHRTVDHVLDHHDLQRLPDGRLVGFEYVTSDRGLEEEARFVALDENDDEDWVWRTEDHIDVSEMVPAPYKSGNFAHVNAVEPDGDGGVVWSARSLDAIYAVDLATDEIRWKLGGTDRPESLRVSDGTRILDPAEVVNLFAGQHDPRFWPDGTISVMDNGSSDQDRRPRVLRFALDLEERLATVVEVVSDPRAVYSGGTGSARRLSGGNWVATWGLPNANRYFTEITPAGEPVLTVSGAGTYRVVPFEAGDLDVDALADGMDAMAGTPTGITGTVVDRASGLPIAGAGVAVLRADGYALADGVVTGADGGFSASVPPGSYLVYLLGMSGQHRSGFVGAPTTLNVDAGAPTDVVGTMEPLRGTVTGTVTSEGSGAPIPGAWSVMLDAVTGAPVAGAIADEAGRYTTGPLPVRSYKTAHLDPTGSHASRFHAGVPDAATATPVAVTAGGTAVADVELPAQAPNPGGSTLVGHVTDETGSPLSGIWVVALSAADYSLVATATTDADGDYALGLPEGGYQLIFLDPSGRYPMEWHDDRPYHALAEADTVIAPGTVDAELADSTGRIVGAVGDAPAGDRLPGIWVVAIGATGIAGGTLTGADGSYSIAGLAPGVYRVTFVDPTGARPQEYWNDAATYEDATPVPVQAGATAVASGRIGP
ncbi:MAG: carboxypeptidase regulatory-like domain-containing protein [Acidimicrobiales bacterium]|nr:carboxypeptidase regulatory-like domain-containing protein [Acidimicrobiales bacterium]